MQTITMKTATTAEAILAIDLGKYKSVACLYGAADDVRFLSIPTSRDEPRVLMSLRGARMSFLGAIPRPPKPFPCQGRGVAVAASSRTRWPNLRYVFGAASLTPMFEARRRG